LTGTLEIFFHSDGRSILSHQALIYAMDDLVEAVFLSLILFLEALFQFSEALLEYLEESIQRLVWTHLC